MDTVPNYEAIDGASMPLPGDIEATLCGWRVLGLPREWSDRNGRSWSTSTQISGTSDEVSIWLGDIPEHVVRGVREFHANSHVMLGRFSGRLADKSSDEIDQLLNELAASADGAEKNLRGSYFAWLTLQIARPVTLPADLEATTPYFRSDTAKLISRLDTFSEYSANQLDLALAALLPALGEDLSVGGVLSRRRRTYIVTPGRMTWGMPDLEGSALTVVRTTSWAELPFTALKDALNELPRSDEKAATMTRSASRWFTAALAEEKDKLRRFQFAFFGLEVLANKVGKDVEKVVVSELSAELGVPVTHLVWPSPSDSDSPWRNLTFRFAMMALRVHRDTAAEDIERFKLLAGQRNGLAHGRSADEDLKALPDYEAISLLQRYLAAVVRHYRS